jgi:hypothetical protein
MALNGKTVPRHPNDELADLEKDLAIYTLDGFLAGAVALSTLLGSRAANIQKSEFIALSRTHLNTDEEGTPSGWRQTRPQLLSTDPDPELVLIQERVREKYRLVTYGESECSKKMGSAPYRKRERSTLFKGEILDGQSSSIDEGSADVPDSDLPLLEEKIHERYRDWFVDEPGPEHEHKMFRGTELPFDRTEFDASKPWCFYDVMLIEWKDGVAYREGIGVCHIDAFRRANPVVRRIVLG